MLGMSFQLHLREEGTVEWLLLLQPRVGAGSVSVEPGLVLRASAALGAHPHLPAAACSLKLVLGGTALGTTMRPCESIPMRFLC